MISVHFIFILIFSSFGIIVCGHLIDGIFTQPTLMQGYNLVAAIPMGATNLNVTELRHTNNYLAIRLRNGSFLLNGNYSIAWSGVYRAAGTKFVYHRQTHQQLESFGATGPLNEPIDVMVLYQEPNPGIIYRYIIPQNLKNGAINNESGRNPTHLYHHRAYETTSSKDKKSMIDDGSLLSSVKQLHKRKFGWRATDVTICSKSCGSGVQMKSYICIREHTQMQVSSKRCHNVEKPSDIQMQCNVEPCPPRWRTSKWSTCSVTCGSGIRTRHLECIQEFNSQSIVHIEDSACAASISPPVTDICVRMPICKNVLATNEFNVHTIRWQVGNWSQCSTSCGPGLRIRPVHCIHHHHFCSINDKPIESVGCNLGACNTFQNNNSVMIQKSPWLYTEWTRECSVECGIGIQMRRISCGSLSPDESCNPEHKPELTRTCSANTSCSGRWFTGPWSKCMTSCGNGEQTREVVCMTTIHGTLRMVLDMNCPIDKPKSQKPCGGPQCPATWFISDWEECSQSCGKGIQTRLVKCLYSEGDLLSMNSSHCNIDNQPISKRTCNSQACENTINSPDNEEYHWFTQLHNDSRINNGLLAHDKNCRDTMSNCGLVIQARLCKYPFYRKVCCFSCFNIKYDME